MENKPTDGKAPRPQMTLEEMIRGPKIVIDPDEAGKILTIEHLTDQQLEALEDCGYIIIHPIMNLKYQDGHWEPIPMGQLSQDSSVIVVRKI